MSRKRILFILHTPPPVHGSSVVGQAIKNSELINKAFDCRYINLGTSKTIDEIGRKPVLKVLRYFQVLWKVWLQFIRFKPQCCYIAITAKGPAFYKDSIVALFAKFFGVRVVYHFHNKGVSTQQHKLFDHLLYRFVFSNTHAILLSKYLYPDVAKYFTAEQVHYCPNGIPDVIFGEKVPHNNLEQNIAPTEILFLSNLIESKGVFVLLEACKLLQQNSQPFRCTFVGGDGDITAQQFQQKLKELDLEEKVIYAGKKFGREKEEAFSKADIFALPTTNDCFPLVLLEAIQHSLPVVSTFEGGIPDIVDDGKTGFLVPQNDAQALADKLQLLIQNPSLRAEMGKAGREKYECEFTLNRFEQQLKGILKEIAE